MQPQQVMQQRWDSCQKEDGQADRQKDRQTHRQACGHVDRHTNKLVCSFKKQTTKMQSSSLALMAVSVVPGTAAAPKANTSASQMSAV